MGAVDAPAAGANAVESWSTADVQRFLNDVGLAELGPEFQKNAVNGQDLLLLSDEDYTEHLGARPLQIRKIKSEVAKRRGGAGSALPVAAVPPPPPVVAAPQVVRQPSAAKAVYPPAQYSPVEQPNSSPAAIALTPLSSSGPQRTTSNMNSQTYSYQAAYQAQSPGNKSMGGLSMESKEDSSVNPATAVPATGYPQQPGTAVIVTQPASQPVGINCVTQLVLLIFGIFFGFPWIIGALLPLCTKPKWENSLDKSCWLANCVLSVLFIVVIIVAAVMISNSSCDSYYGYC